MKIKALDKRFWEKIVDWCSIDEFKERSRLDVTPYTEQQILNEFAGYIQNPNCRIFQIEKESELVGFIMLKNIDLVNKRCEFHVEIPEKQYQNNGIGIRAINWIENYAFNQLNLNKIKTSVLSSNPSMDLAERLGYVKEGILKNEYFINGKYEDLHLFSKGRESCQ
jgi:RimJ/RimL family protein N-acetyltransferase